MLYLCWFWISRPIRQTKFCYTHWILVCIIAPHACIELNALAVCLNLCTSARIQVVADFGRGLKHTAAYKCRCLPEDMQESRSRGPGPDPCSLFLWLVLATPADLICWPKAECRGPWVLGPATLAGIPDPLCGSKSISAFVCSVL